MNMQTFGTCISGGGSNMHEIGKYFEGNTQVEMTNVYGNMLEKKAIDRACEVGISPQLIHIKKNINKQLIETFEEDGIDYLVLAGFLKQITPDIIEHFKSLESREVNEASSDFRTRILNIHPGLLPWGGKGKYGHHVHEHVMKYLSDNPELPRIAGLTIHEVNENYDDGKIIFQAGTEVLKNDTPETIQKRILENGEWKYYARVIEEYILRTKGGLIDEYEKNGIIMF